MSFRSIDAERQLPTFMIEEFGRSPYFRLVQICDTIHKKISNQLASSFVHEYSSLHDSF